MANYAKLDNFLEAHLDDSIAELSRLVAQPSVGAQNLGMKECAALVAQMLRKRGLTTEVMPTPGAPVVYGERKGKSDRTLLFYCHYDVQPAEPLELWVTPPFEPSLRDGKLYGRGVSDDKGHLVARLFAIDALLAEADELPCKIKFIIEGEEETSSASKLTPAFCNSVAWTTPRRRSSISACAASATWNSLSKLQPSMSTPVSAARSSPTPRGGWSGR